MPSLTQKKDEKPWDGMGWGWGVGRLFSAIHLSPLVWTQIHYRITQDSAPAESVTAEGRSTILRSPCHGLEFTSTVHLTWKHLSESGNRGMSNMLWFPTRNHLSTQIINSTCETLDLRPSNLPKKKNGPCFDLPRAATAAHLCTELHQNILQGFVGSIHHQEFQHQVERVDLEEGLHIDRVSQARHLLYLTGCIQMISNEHSSGTSQNPWFN